MTPARYAAGTASVEAPSTGLSRAERANIRIGDTVAVFAQGSIGLCATAGAKLSGATWVIGVDRLSNRLDIARRMGADHVIDSSRTNPIEEILRLTAGRLLSRTR